MRTLLTALFLFFVCSCGSERPLPETGGEVCVDFGDVFCERLIDCGGYQGTQNACVAEFYASCCGDEGTCGNRVNASLTQAGWNDCLDATEDLSCSDVNAGNLPPACLRL